MKKASHFGPWPRTTKNGLPCLWLFTDERMAVSLSQLPRGTGVVIRHYDHPQRAAFVRALVQQGHARGLIMLVAGDIHLAIASGADGVHLPEYQLRPVRKPYRGFIITAAVHDRVALQRARHCDGAFLSPVFASRSHPGGKTLGRLRSVMFARTTGSDIFALGGITSRNARQLAALGFSGIAAIDGWSACTIATCCTDEML